MILDSNNADALRRVFSSERKLNGKLKNIHSYTLPGLMETFAFAVSFEDNSLINELQTLNLSGDPFKKAVEAWAHNGTLPRNGIYEANKLEFFRFRERKDQIGLSYILFQQRFTKSLRENNFQPSQAEAFAGAMQEMSDNIVQHSALKPPFYGLVGYHVEKNYMSFCVIDLGQGVLSSFSGNKYWRHIKTPEDALYAIVCKKASSRPDQPEGEGFKTLLKSLADRNCRLRFRSDDAVLWMDSKADEMEARDGKSHPLKGFQLSVCCSLKTQVEEKIIQNS